MSTSPPSPRVDDADWWRAFELRAGTRWVTWLGAAALVVGAALFVKLAIDRGWLGPTARLVLGTAGGVALLVAGRRAHRAEMRPLAQGLFGAGLGVLYVATYVAYASYGLIARELVFGSMIGVTVLGCVLAIRHDAQPVAILALVGGLITPVAVSTGDGSREALCTYLVVLDLGALGIALGRRWRALELIAMAGTWLLYAGWLERAHVPAAWQAELAWVAVFHAVLVGLPIGYHLVRREEVSPRRLEAAVANAVLAFAFAAVILDRDRGALGAAATALAAVHGLLGAAVARRLPGDRRTVAGFLGVAAVLATAAVPLLMRGDAVTVAWGLEAPAVLALGFAARSHAIRLAALGVLGLALANGVAEWPMHRVPFEPFANAGFVRGLIMPVVAALYAIAHRMLAYRGDERDAYHGIGAALASLAIALVLVHAELRSWLALADRTTTGPAAVPLIWAAGAFAALALCGHRRDALATVPAAVATSIAGVLAAIAYAGPALPDATLVLNVRFASALAAVAAGAATAHVTARRDPLGAARLRTIVLAGLGLAIGAEAYLSSPRHAQTALSIAWSCYAAVLLGAGFALDRRALRLGGLGLVGLVAAKLVLIDLEGTAQIYRVLSFLIVGALMIGVSYAYHRLERRRG